MAAIKIIGNNQMDTDIRLASLIKINSFDTETLSKIAELLNSEKARNKFKQKANLLKSFI